MKNIIKTFSLAAIICAASFASESKTITIDEFLKTKNAEAVFVTSKKECKESFVQFAEIWNTADSSNPKITDTKSFKKIFTSNIKDSQMKYEITEYKNKINFVMIDDPQNYNTFLFFDTIKNCKDATDPIKDKLIPWTESVIAATAE